MVVTHSQSDRPADGLNWEQDHENNAVVSEKNGGQSRSTGGHAKALKLYKCADFAFPVDESRRPEVHAFRNCLCISKVEQSTQSWLHIRK